MRERRVPGPTYMTGLNVLPLAIPPLRARREDVPELARHFLELAARSNDRRDVRLENDAIAVLAGATRGRGTCAS